MIIGKITIRPTQHYLQYHTDVEWDIVVEAIVSPTKTQPNKRRGKDRFTYIKRMQKWIVEIHTKNDEVNSVIWVINAFKKKR